MRLHVADADAVPARIPQAQPPLVPAGRRDAGEQLGVRLVPFGPGQRDGGRVKRADPVP